MTSAPQPDRPAWLEAFETRLGTHTLGRPLVYLPRTASTNTVAADLARQGAADGTLVVTDDQHAGRGRMGRAWHAAPGQNLTVSLVLRPAMPVAEWPLVGFAAAVAAARALEARLLEAHLPGATVHVKWPNDLVLDGRKVAGVLLETAPGALVLGLGLNVNQTRFDGAFVLPPTSLALATGAAHERGEVLAEVLGHLEALLPFCAGQGQSVLLNLYTARLAGLGGPVVFRETASAAPVEGRLVGLSASGTLQLETADGLRSFRAGDLTTHAP